MRSDSASPSASAGFQTSRTEGLTRLAPFPSKWLELYVVSAVALAALFGFRRLISTDFGLVLKAIRDNDRSVMSGGINIYFVKAQALFIAGCVGAFCGAYMTHVYMFVSMPAFALDYSILPLASAVVGGMGAFAGSLMGPSFSCRSPRGFEEWAGCGP